MRSVGWSADAGRIKQSRPDGGQEQARRGVDRKLAHQAGAVGINRLVADAERFRRADIGVAARNRLQDGEFPVSYRHGFDRRFQKPLRARADCRPALEYLTHDLNDFVFRAVFEANAVNAGLDECADCLRHRRACQENKSRFGRPALGFEEHFHSVRAGHIVIQYGTVGP
jgi:hypothetical protein